MYTKESLTLLRDKVNLVDLIGRHIKMERTGHYFRACCPFHSEKTPSFNIEAGASHYHCFGCGAHGDAIAFAMQYLGFRFAEAIEYLAAEFHVPLIKSEQKEDKSSRLKMIMEKVADGWHRYLLHTQSGHLALEYLFSRGIDLDMVMRFRFGLCPSGDFLTKLAHRHRFTREEMELLGLMRKGGRPFFADRITLPICDRMGNVIGYTARKWIPEMEGPKYINSPETPLFKKSKLLFGIHIARRKIAKEGRVILVEGQIDTIRLIQNGFEESVGVQGTAFGHEQALDLLSFGLKEALILFDGDSAGQKAAVKVAQILLEKGIDAKIARLPPGVDPDLLVLKEGKEALAGYLNLASDFSEFLIDFFRSQDAKMSKAQLVAKIVPLVAQWKEPIARHEARQKVAKALQLPLELVDLPKTTPKTEEPAPIPVLASPKQDSLAHWLEKDFLRIVLAMAASTPSQLVELVKNFSIEELKVPLYQKIFATILDQVKEGQALKILDLVALFTQEEHLLIEELLEKRVQVEKAKEALQKTKNLLTHRERMISLAGVKKKMEDPSLGESERLHLLKIFSQLSKR